MVGSIIEVSLSPSMRLFDKLRAHLYRHPFWQVKYMNGLRINEWQMDWSLLPREGRQTVRLYCPNGHVAELGSDDSSWRLFQFKVGRLMGNERTTLAHVVGLITDPSTGDCTYAAWDCLDSRLVTGEDNVLNMKYHQTGKLSGEVLGFRVNGE